VHAAFVPSLAGLAVLLCRATDCCVPSGLAFLDKGVPETWTNQGVCAVPNGTCSSFFPISWHCRAGLQVVGVPSGLAFLAERKFTPWAKPPKLRAQASPIAVPRHTVSNCGKRKT
jgi:hypothetical protein